MFFNFDLRTNQNPSSSDAEATRRRLLAAQKERRRRGQRRGAKTSGDGDADDANAEPDKNTKAADAEAAKAELEKEQHEQQQQHQQEKQEEEDEQEAAASLLPTRLVDSFAVVGIPADLAVCHKTEEGKEQEEAEIPLGRGGLPLPQFDLTDPSPTDTLLAENFFPEIDDADSGGGSVSTSGGIVGESCGNRSGGVGSDMPSLSSVSPSSPPSSSSASSQRKREPTTAVVDEEKKAAMALEEALFAVKASRFRPQVCLLEL